MTDNSNMRIWSAVERTNPAYTKKVNQRGGFTAISAQYQIMEATEQFGPIGIGWGYKAEAPILMDGLVVIPVSLWHGSRDNVYGPMSGSAELRSSNGKIDSDAPKKATTDALTKLLSQLGFNADVFLGKFDDNKYVAEVTREFRDLSKEKLPDDAPKAAQAKRELTWDDVQAKFDAATTVDGEGGLDARYDWFIANNKIPHAWKIQFDEAYEKRRDAIYEEIAAADMARE